MTLVTIWWKHLYTELSCAY